MNTTTLHMAQAAPPATDRLPLKQKVGFGLGSVLDMGVHWLYASLAFHVFNIFLGVAPGLISTGQAIKIVIDAGSDAVFGWLSDNTRTRYGRRRPFILVGGVLAGVGLPVVDLQGGHRAGRGRVGPDPAVQRLRRQAGRADAGVAVLDPQLEATRGTV